MTDKCFPEWRLNLTSHPANLTSVLNGDVEFSDSNSLHIWTRASLERWLFWWQSLITGRRITLDNRSTAKQFIAALERLDTAPIVDLLADDEPAVVFDGKEAVMSVQNVIVDAFSAVEFIDPRVTGSADGQTVFVEAVGRRVQRRTGLVYKNVYLLKFDFRDGLICRITEYSNPVAFAKFFGQPIG
jgi:ketosteroid isomerase-like protein